MRASGATCIEQALDVVQRGGRVVVTGLFGGTINLPVTTFPGKAISVHGVFVGSIAEFRYVGQAQSGAVWRAC